MVAKKSLIRRKKPVVSESTTVKAVDVKEENVAEEAAPVQVSEPVQALPTPSEVPEITSPAPAASTPVTEDSPGGGIASSYDVSDSSSEEEEASGNDYDSNKSHTILGKLKWVIAFFVFLGFLVAVAYFSYMYGLTQGKNVAAIAEKSKKATVTPTLTETQEEVDLSAYTIEILNGSGKSGEASVLQDSLVEMGYKVEKIGNSPDSVKKTIIKSKKSVPTSFVKSLNKELADTYTLDDAEELEISEVTDVIIVIGSSKKQE